MTEIPNRYFVSADKFSGPKVSVIGISNLEIICNLVLEIWNFYRQ